MNCKRCGSDEVMRSRRRGLLDGSLAALGWWPYRCESCSYRFFTRWRYPELALSAGQATRKAPAHESAGADFRSYATQAERERPEMAFKTHTDKPHAKIVLQADSHEQLNNILIALNHAVNSYQQTSGTHPSTKSKSNPVGAER